jgi:TonB family protein
MKHILKIKTVLIVLSLILTSLSFQQILNISQINSQLSFVKKTEKIKLITIQPQRDETLLLKKELQPKKQELRTSPTNFNLSIDPARPNLPFNLTKINTNSGFNYKLSPNFTKSIGFKVSTLNISTKPITGIIPLYKIPPEYPYKAKQRSIEGQVTLEFTINKVGKVEDIKVVKAVPPNVFNRSAIEALKNWQFKPQSVGGEVANVRAQQEIIFKMSS